MVGTNLFKTKEPGTIVTAARKSEEIFKAVTTDPYNLDKFLQALAHMVVTAKKDKEHKWSSLYNVKLRTKTTYCPGGQGNRILLMM